MLKEDYMKLLTPLEKVVAGKLMYRRAFCGSGWSKCFWASRIQSRIKKSEIRIRLAEIREKLVRTANVREKIQKRVKIALFCRIGFS
jgi:hypothetical protein